MNRNRELIANTEAQADESLNADGYAVLDDRDSGWLVARKTRDGYVVTRLVSKKTETRLVYEHGLYEVLKTGTEVLESDGVRMWQFVSQGVQGFKLTVDDEQAVFVGASEYDELLDALAEYYEGNAETIRTPLKNFYFELIDDRIRRSVVDRFLEEQPFATFSDMGTIESNEQGWVIGDEPGYVVTNEGDIEFRSGSSTRDIYRLKDSVSGEFELVTEDHARKLQHTGTSFERREVAIDGESITLSAKESAFLARVLWAIRREYN